MLASIQDLLSRAIVGHVTYLTRESDEVIGAFLRGQFIVMAMLGVFYSVTDRLTAIAPTRLRNRKVVGAMAALPSSLPAIYSATLMVRPIWRIARRIETPGGG